MEDIYLLRALVIAAFVSSFGVSGYYRWRAKEGGGARPERGDEPASLVVARVLVAVPLYLGFLVWALNPSWMEWSHASVPSWLRWFGAALVFLTVPLTWWVMRHLATNVTETALVSEKPTLVTTGPYRWVRHPLYTDGILLWTGISLAAANLQLGLFTLLFAIVWLGFVIPREEEALLREFGASYAAYRKETGRLLPRLLSRTTGETLTDRRSHDEPSEPMSKGS